MTHEVDERPRHDDRLRLELLFGKAIITASEVELGPWTRLAELRAEIPGRRYPFDLGAAPDRFRGTRAVATALTIDLDGARLARTLSGVVRTLEDVTELSVELLDDEVRVVLEPVVPNGEIAPRIICRLALVPDVTGGQDLKLVTFDELVLGSHRRPGSVELAGLLPRLLRSPELTPSVSRLAPRVERDTLSVAAARLGLAEAFVRRRWKMPGAERLRWQAVSVAPGRATLRAAAPNEPEPVSYALGEPRNRRAAVASLEVRAVAAEAESEYFAGRFAEAADRYRQALQRFGNHAFLRARYVASLLASEEPTHTAEAREAVRRMLEVAPDDPTALAAAATLGARSRDVDGAIAAAQRLADALGRAGRDEDRVEALLFASRVAATRSPREGVQWVDRALRLAPRSPAVLRQRVRLARAAGDADAYEDGLSRLLSLARSKQARGRLHRELGRLARDRRGDHEAARVHLQEAVILCDDDASLLLEFASVSEAAGRAVDAIRAFRKAADLRAGAAPDEAADALARAARVWESTLADPHNALIDVRRALALAPSSGALLTALVRLSAATRDDELLLRAFERAVGAIDESTPDGRDALRSILRIAIDADLRRGQIEAAAAKRRRLDALSSGGAAVPSSPEPTGAPRPSGAHRSGAVGAAAAGALASPTRSQDYPVVALRDAATDAASDVTPAPSADPARLARVDAALAEARRDGAPERLVEALPEAIELEPDSERRAALSSELGQLLYYELEDAGRALQYLEEAQRLSPDGAGADYGLLSALEEIYENTASAEGLMTIYRRKLAQAQEGEIRTVYRLLMAGVLFERLGRSSDAVALLDEVLESDPRNVPALRLRARIWQATGRRAEAADALESLIEMPEVDPFERQDLLRELGRHEWQAMGRLERAAGRFETLLAEIPGDTDCISSLKQIYARADRWDRVVDVLRRELGILAGAPAAFPDIEAAVAMPPTRIAEPLRATFGRILTEAAALLHERLDAPSLALRAARAAAVLASDDVFIHEQLLELALSAQAHDDAIDAALVVAPQLVDPNEREAMFARLEPTARRVGRLAELGRATGVSTGEARAADGGACAEAGKDSPGSRLERLDAMAAAGAFAEAVGAIDAWLPAARRPALRRELLLRKGRWLLDRGADARSALLPLKGALILDPSAAETRLELLRASCRLGDVAQATDQLRHYLASRGADSEAIGDDECHRLRCAIDDLTAMPKGPGADWVDGLFQAAAPALAARVRAGS